MYKHNKLIYAFQGEKIVSINEVQSGKACGCVCPACGGQLIAKKGDKKMKHFAHISNIDCHYGYQTSLHLVAKEIFTKAKKIVLPAVYFYANTNCEKKKIREPEEIIIDRVELEKGVDDIIPDIVIYSGENKYFVEIFVTHKIDEIKLNKIKQIGIPVIEINLSDLDNNITEEMLTEILLQDNDCKEWVYSLDVDNAQQEVLRRSVRRNIISRGFACHIDNCPMRMRKWHGKYYASLMDDCVYCENCTYMGENYILCDYTGNKEDINEEVIVGFVNEDTGEVLQCNTKYSLQEIWDVIQKPFVATRDGYYIKIVRNPKEDFERYKMVYGYVATSRYNLYKYQRSAQCIYNWDKKEFELDKY